MKPPRKKSLAPAARQLASLRARLAEANATLRAIRRGEVDSVIVAGKRGPQVFTLEGAERTYRALIESMNEGALTLTGDKAVLYANQCFARMVKCPLEQVVGGSFRRFLSPADHATLRPMMKRAARDGSKMQLVLLAGDGSSLPVQISVREIARDGAGHFTIGMVVTDMTEARRTEELLRALTQRVVQVQEAERGHTALELHDHITQPLIAVLFRSQALANSLSARHGPAKREAEKLRALLGQAAGEVERISRTLRPGVLDQLGLVEALHVAATEFTNRTGVPVQLECGSFPTGLPAATELALYRIFQETLKNVEQHARARYVTVGLKPRGGLVQLLVKDDGVGFNAVHHAARRKGKGVLGLLGMRERAIYVGGTLTVKSGPSAGTEIEALIPLPPPATAAA